MRALARSLSASALAPCSSRRAPRARPVRAAPKRAMAACAGQCTPNQGERVGGVIARGAAAAKAHAPLLPDRLPRASVAAPAEAYTQLKAELSEIAALGGIEGLLSWDQAAMLPPGAQELRAKQMAALAGVIHARKTATELGEVRAPGHADAMWRLLLVKYVQARLTLACLVTSLSNSSLPSAAAKAPTLRCWATARPPSTWPM